MNVKKKVHGAMSDGKHVFGINVTVRITADERGKTLSLSAENPFTGVMLSIPMELIEKELKKVLE